MKGPAFHGVGGGDLLPGGQPKLQRGSLEVFAISFRPA